MKTYLEQAQECLTEARWAWNREDTSAAMYWTSRAQVYATLAVSVADNRA